MKTESKPRTGRAAQAALAAIAAMAISLPTVALPQEKTPSGNCSEALEEFYGAVDVNVTRANNVNKRNSVYADVTRADGQVVRFRCLQRKTGIPKVQAFLPAGPGSPMPWRHWTDADSFRAERPQAAEAEPEAAPEPMAPAEPRRVPVP